MWHIGFIRVLDDSIGNRLTCSHASIKEGFGRVVGGKFSQRDGWKIFEFGIKS